MIGCLTTDKQQIDRYITGGMYNKYAEGRAMVKNDSEYRISGWLVEFFDRDTETSFQSHLERILILQLRIALVVWGSMLMLYAISDYTALGLTRPFYYLLAWRVTISVALLILFFYIRPERNLFKVSYPVTFVAMAGFSGYMLLFFYRPDVTVWTVVVMMLQLVALLIFIPIRFIMSFSVSLYAVAITMLACYARGFTISGLVGLFILLILPVVIGASTASRLGILQRREYVHLMKVQKINQEMEKSNADLQKALSEVKQLSGMLPICAHCKKIRDDRGYWNQIEEYIKNHSQAEFSHSLCPECAKSLYPEFYKEE